MQQQILRGNKKHEIARERDRDRERKIIHDTRKKLNKTHTERIASTRKANGGD